METLQQRVKWWMTIVNRGGPIRNNVFDCTFVEVFGLYRKAIDPEKREFVKKLRDRGVIPTKNKCKI